MKVETIATITGELPDFMMMAQLRELAAEWFDPQGGWTHLEGADDDDVELLAVMVNTGIADHAKVISEGKLLDLFRWHQE
jgi:hypothetical protein